MTYPLAGDKGLSYGAGQRGVRACNACLLQLV